MPRIRPQEFFKAKAINKSLLALLPVCRDLNSARNELRWMKEHAISVSRRLGYSDYTIPLRSLVDRRAGGEPLQYVLESEYFGELEIKCRPGVLIPRQETAASISHLAHLVSQSKASVDEPGRNLRVLDLCTGTGCIPLLFHHEYYRGEAAKNDRIELVGVDISSTALSLARENLIHQIAKQRETEGSNVAQRTRSLNSIGFVQADVLKHNQADTPLDEDESGKGPPSLLPALHRLNSDSSVEFDILISNPPYISPESFKSTTSRSVRRFEPRLALVPPSASTSSDTQIGDLFYPRLLQISEQVNAKIILFEVADLKQAQRVAAMAVQSGNWDSIEVWRDDPAVLPASDEKIEINGKSIVVKGTGNGRSVFAYRSEALAWLQPRPRMADVVPELRWPDVKPDR